MGKKLFIVIFYFFTSTTNAICVLDFRSSFIVLEIKNQFIQNQLSKSNILFVFSAIILLMSIGIIFLLNRNYKKNKKIHELNILQSKKELAKKECKKIKLSENLKVSSEELNTSILNIKKVALLKKQMENILDEKSPNYNEKETLKKLKLCLNSFFDNYKELTHIMQKKLNVNKIINSIKKEYPDINEKEIKVIEYIVLQFTTREIAVLMGKSEKSIEYYRSQIRKKFDIKSNISLEEFLNI
jgi:DNA-binding CsgD family transcriptional regulator